MMRYWLSGFFAALGATLAGVTFLHSRAMRKALKHPRRPAADPDSGRLRDRRNGGAA